MAARRERATGMQAEMVATAKSLATATEMLTTSTVEETVVTSVKPEATMAEMGALMGVKGPTATPHIPKKDIHSSVAIRTTITEVGCDKLSKTDDHGGSGRGGVEIRPANFYK